MMEKESLKDTGKRIVAEGTATAETWGKKGRQGRELADDASSDEGEAVHSPPAVQC